ncbi:MAG TPA: lasso peptide biosynthesis B2 protein [Thermoleophilaceae bacterium]|nr:lasso peptide biosynthesis B2 protein [Thermoleophilaceae bacterium]
MRSPLGARIRRRLRLLAGCIRGPGDLWLATRMLGWRLVLPALKWRFPLPRLVRLMWWSGEPDAPSAERNERIAALARALSGPAEIRALDNCLERSLILYRFLSRAGAEPELVVGFSRSGGEVGAHAWVYLDGQALPWHEEPLDEFETAIRFGRGGAIDESADAA